MNDVREASARTAQSLLNRRTALIGLGTIGSIFGQEHKLDKRMQKEIKRVEEAARRNGPRDFKFSSDDTNPALMDRRWRFVRDAGSDSDLQRFEGAQPQEQIDVFVEVFGNAFGQLTVAVNNWKAPSGLKRGLFIAIARFLGVEYGDEIVQRTFRAIDKRAEAAMLAESRAKLAAQGLANAKLLVAQFLGVEAAKSFESENPIEKVDKMLVALQTIMTKLREPGLYAVWMNDVRGTKQRGESGRQIVQTLLGSSDRRTIEWESLSRGQRDDAVQEAVTKMFADCRGALRDDSGKKFADLAKQTGIERGFDDQHLYKASGKSDTTDPANATAANRAALLMELAWRYGFYILLGVDPSLLAPNN